MTATETRIAAGAGVPTGAGVWRAEFAETVRLAAPMALTQLGQIAMMTTDLILIGRGMLHETMGRLRTHAYGIIRHAPCPVLSV